MKKRYLGNKKLEVSEIGLGCMGMSYGRPSYPSEEELIRFVHQAMDMGITMFDTAEVYGDNEELLGKALEGRYGRIVIATKGCNYEVNGKTVINCNPDRIRKSLEGSLRKLKTDYIDLYYVHRYDGVTPIEEVAGLMSEFMKEGKIGNWGMCEVSTQTIRKAIAGNCIYI